MERVASLSRLDVRGARLSCLRGSALLQDGLMMVQENFVPAWAPPAPSGRPRAASQGAEARLVGRDRRLPPRHWDPHVVPPRSRMRQIRRRREARASGTLWRKALRDHVSAGPP